MKECKNFGFSSQARPFELLSLLMRTILISIHFYHPIQYCHYHFFIRDIEENTAKEIYSFSGYSDVLILKGREGPDIVSKTHHGSLLVG